MKWKYVFALILFLSIGVATLSINNVKSIETNKEVKISLKITNTSSKSIYSSYSKQNIYLYGWFDRDMYKIDDELEVIGTFHTVDKLIKMNQNFFKSKNIKYYFDVKDVIKYTKSTGLRRTIIDYFTSGNNTYSKYMNLLFFGQKNWNNEEIYNLAVENSIIHLFVISGFHVVIFSKIIKKTCGFAKINEFNSLMITVAILTFYLWLINFTIPSVRALSFFVILNLNKRFLRKKIENTTILITIALFFLLINIYQIYNASFILSFGATFIVLTISKWKWRNRIIQYVLTTVVIFISIIPMSIYFNGYFNILGIVHILLMTPLLSLVYCSTIFLLFFRPILEIIFYSLNIIMIQSNKTNILINVPFGSLIYWMPYYLIYFSYLTKITIFNKNRKWAPINQLYLRNIK